jgi:anaerobic magnesium-protoporphyrin IX monomethyl ester cyclase
VVDVLIGQAYYLRFDPKLWRAQQPFAPLGALYAASYLRSRGHTTTLFDAMLAESAADWSTALDRVRPRFAVLYEDSFNYLSKMCLLRMRDAALGMIASARTRGCAVIVSGSDATDHPDVYLRAGATAVVLGEGEVTLAELIATIADNGSPANVAGVAHLCDGAVMRTGARPVMRDLDDLPRPAWDLVDTDHYRRIWRARHGYYAMNLATTRGCPFHCNWCAKPIYGQRYTVRTAANVVDEMTWLKRTYAPDQLSIADDVFGLQPGWVHSFAHRLGHHQDARIPFRCLMRADQINADITEALVAAGCRMVWMGAESGSQRVLDAMDKGVTVAQIRNAAKQLQHAGIQVGMFLQFGYPGETWDDVEKTLQLVRDASPDDIGVSVSYPLPGTKFYERVRAELGEKQNWTDSDELAMMYRAAYPPEFYRRLHHVVHHEFRARQLAQRVSALVKTPARLRLPDLRRVAAWAYHRSALPFASYELRRLAR